MDILVDADGHLMWPGNRVRCALGRAGITADKHEGDGRTPAGTFELRGVFYRPDRLHRPRAGLPVRAIRPDDGWCDWPGDPLYNCWVRLPYPARSESLWRDDTLYDLIVILGHNDSPVVAGRGSAVFLHVAAPAYDPTEGCVAVTQADLVRLLARCRPGDRLVIP
jgi:L,D-peptidoglycan transpeptidase YkuD (ErfK/YbiS/YcfS/YnhG family)